MKIGLRLTPEVEVSWRAADSDAQGVRRLAMLRQSVGMDDLPENGQPCSCPVVSRAEIDMASSFGIPRHGMRIVFSKDFRSCRTAFADFSGDTPEQIEIKRWRGVRQLLFLGLVPHMLRGECFMVHGVLAGHDNGGVLICGPSGIGKSTTAGKLPGTFRMLADDCFLLYPDGKKWSARPLPTWSSYLFGKERLVECDARVALSVERILILGRNAARYTELSSREALLGVSNAFTDMVTWHASHYPEQLRLKLTEIAFNAAVAVTSVLRCGALQLTLESDISSVLPE